MTTSTPVPSKDQHENTKRSARDVSFGADAEWFASGPYVDGPVLPLLPKVCRDAHGRIDCAVIGGLYRGISNDLKKCPFDLQERVSGRWFCHNHRGHACRGNALNLGRGLVAALATVTSPSHREGEATLQSPTQASQPGGEEKE